MTTQARGSDGDQDTQSLVANLQKLRTKVRAPGQLRDARRVWGLTVRLCQTVRSTWSFARAKTSQALSEKKVQEYQDTFAKIADITGATSVEELVRMFVAAEERNYSLFRYASQINAELEQQNHATAEVRAVSGAARLARVRVYSWVHAVGLQLHAEVEKYKGMGVETDDKRRRVLESLINALERTEAKIKEHEIENAVRACVVASC